jgi:class 3 adenylate cyclase/tetratricopeptide (TPR) repeat protein
VLFCDLVDSTSIATQLDPEEWRELIAGYHRAAAQAVERFGGYLARYLGDGVVAYFGWPRAHENDAERAVRAAFAVLHSIDRLNQKPAPAKLFARLGIHSGAVVVGAGAGGGDDIFGDVPNIAARVQAAAEPGTVLVTEATHRLVAGLFEAVERGPQNLKGIAQPQRLYLVKQQIAGRRRSAVRPRLTPFIGREDQLKFLLDRWNRTRQGNAQVVFLVGEPGIGKSRLIRQFQEQIAGDAHIWIEAAGDQLAQNTPFHAVAEMLRGQVVSSSPENAEQSIEQLASLLRVAGLRPRQTLPLIASLLNLPVPNTYPAGPAGPEEQRRQLLAALCGWAIGTARAQPAVLVLEDIQWADASTVEFAKLVAESGGEAPLMRIYSARPGFDLSGLIGSNHAQLTLERLSDREARAMVKLVAPEQGLSAETVTAVVNRATGIPLFVEELTRDLPERGKDARLNAIPASLRDLLAARLDRLGPARELAQIGAAIGREFSSELLRLVANVSERELQLALERLVSSDLLHSRRPGPETSYVFKHALVQDAAYETLLKSRRRELHARIAQILEQHFPETKRSAPELLAHHCTEAGMFEPAVRYWRTAGMKAIERSANVEAIAQLRKGLELLNGLPPTSERLTEEVKLQIALTTPLMAIKGYTSAEVENATNRALELCQEAEGAPHLFAALGNLNAIYFNRSELGIALELGQQMLRLAQTQRDLSLLLWAHYAVGFALASLGKLKLARDHLQQSIAFYERSRAGRYGFVQDPGPTAMAMLSQVLYSLGFPDQALAQLEEAVALARSLSHPFTLAWVLGFAGELYWKRGENSKAQQSWNERFALSTEHGFKPLLESADFSLGFALAEQGGGTDGIAKMRELYARYSSINALPIADKVRWMGLLALAQGKAGQADEALARIDQALALAKKIKKPRDVGDLYLFKGQILLLQNPSAFRKARQCFGSAIEIARDQDAKSEELSATIQMARLIAQQGRRQTAHAMLKKIYSWFTEGFDTASLKEAKALLDELKG